MSDHANEVHVEMDPVDIARLVDAGVIRPVTEGGRTVYEIADGRPLLGNVDLAFDVTRVQHREALERLADL